MLHNHPLPEGYTKVTVDSLSKRKHKNVELDIPVDDSKLLGDNIGDFVAWRKYYIIFESESKSFDHDPRESPERDLPPSPMSEKARHLKGNKVHEVRLLKGSKLLLALQKKREHHQEHRSYHLRIYIQNRQKSQRHHVKGREGNK